MPRDAATRVRYPENLRPGEDTDFAIRLALDGQRFSMLEEPGAVWRDGFDPTRTSAGWAAQAAAMVSVAEVSVPGLSRTRWSTSTASRSGGRSCEVSGSGS